MKTLYVFSATWCGPCQMLKRTLNETNVPVDQLIRVDVDEWKDLTKEFGIRSVPTCVLKVDGEEVARKTGVMNSQQLIDFVS